jgi:hypothetical protein
MASDGGDGWVESVWASDKLSSRTRQGDALASGVAIPQAAADEYVVMRVAELVADCPKRRTQNTQGERRRALLTTNAAFDFNCARLRIVCVICVAVGCSV